MRGDEAKKLVGRRVLGFERLGFESLGGEMWVGSRWEQRGGSGKTGVGIQDHADVDCKAMELVCDKWWLLRLKNALLCKNGTGDIGREVRVQHRSKQDGGLLRKQRL